MCSSPCDMVKVGQCRLNSRAENDQVKPVSVFPSQRCKISDANIGLLEILGAQDRLRSTEALRSLYHRYNSSMKVCWFVNVTQENMKKFTCNITKCMCRAGISGDREGTDGCIGKAWSEM